MMASGTRGPVIRRGAVRDGGRRAPRAAPVVPRGLEGVRDFRGEEEVAAFLRVRVEEPPEDVFFALDVLRPLREAPRCDDEADGMAWWSCEKARVSGGARAVHPRGTDVSQRPL
jgi:hypothetical protein